MTWNVAIVFRLESFELRLAHRALNHHRDRRRPRRRAEICQHGVTPSDSTGLPGLGASAPWRCAVHLTSRQTPPQLPFSPTPTASCSLLWTVLLGNESARSKRAAECLLSHSIYPPRGWGGGGRGGAREWGLYVCWFPKHLWLSELFFFFFFKSRSTWLLTCIRPFMGGNKMIFFFASWNDKVFDFSW